MSLPSPPLPPAPFEIGLPATAPPAPLRTLPLAREGLQRGGGALVAAAALFVLPGWVLIGASLTGEEMRHVDPGTVGPMDGLYLFGGLLQLFGGPVFLVFAALVGFGHRVGRPMGGGRALLRLLRRSPALLLWIPMFGGAGGLLVAVAASPVLLLGPSVLTGVACLGLLLLCSPVLSALYLSLPTAVLHDVPLGIGIRDSWRLAKGRRARSVLVLLFAQVLPLTVLGPSLVATVLFAVFVTDAPVLLNVVELTVEVPLLLFLEPVAALMAASLAVPRTARG